MCDREPHRGTFKPLRASLDQQFNQVQYGSGSVSLVLPTELWRRCYRSISKTSWNKTAQHIYSEFHNTYGSSHTYCMLQLSLKTTTVIHNWRSWGCCPLFTAGEHILYTAQSVSTNINTDLTCWSQKDKVKRKCEQKIDRVWETVETRPHTAQSQKPCLWSDREEEVTTDAQQTQLFLPVSSTTKCKRKWENPTRSIKAVRKKSYVPTNIKTQKDLQQKSFFF